MTNVGLSRFRAGLLGVIFGVLGVAIFAFYLYAVEPTRFVLSYTDKDRLNIVFLTEAALRRELELLLGEERHGRCDPDRIKLGMALIYSDLQDREGFLNMMGAATDLALRADCLSAKEKFLSSNAMAGIARERKESSAAEKYSNQARAWSSIWQKELEAAAHLSGVPAD